MQRLREFRRLPTTNRSQNRARVRDNKRLERYAGENYGKSDIVPAGRSLALGVGWGWRRFCFGWHIADFRGFVRIEQIICVRA